MSNKNGGEDQRWLDSLEVLLEYVLKNQGTEHAPLVVEIGILLDAFMAVFVMGITIFQINREFDHIDTDRLTVLKD